jgi:SAM-dependent methyltransferase
MAHWDMFGRALMAYHLGNTAAECMIERDDGYLDPHSLGHYFIDASQFTDATKAALEHVSGRVLDIGCGAGRILLHLQDRFEVVGMDVSYLALKVCQSRGIKHLVNAMAPSFPLKPGSFDTAILMGNNYGLCGSTDDTREMMKNLYEVLSDNGIIMAQSIDPCATEKEAHLKYHEWNRKRGRPAGQVTIRIGFEGKYSDWFDLLMQNKEEMVETIHPYWKIDSTYGDDSYIAILRKQ